MKRPIISFEDQPCLVEGEWAGREQILSRLAKRRLVIHCMLPSNRGESPNPGGLFEFRRNLYLYYPPKWLPRIYRYNWLDKLTEVGRFNVVRLLCTPLDVVGSDVQLPDVQERGPLGVFASGAYGYTPSPRSLLSHPEPREIIMNE